MSLRKDKNRFMVNLKILEVLTWDKPKFHQVKIFWWQSLSSILHWLIILMIQWNLWQCDQRQDEWKYLSLLYEYISSEPKTQLKSNKKNINNKLLIIRKSNSMTNKLSSISSFDISFYTCWESFFVCLFVFILFWMADWL